ncbi:MAG: hypothetical protein V3U45_07485 [bacterium]
MGPVDDQEFVDRVLEDIRIIDLRRFRSDWLEVLGTWVRPGLAAAAALVVLALATTVSMRPVGPGDDATAMDDAVRAQTLETSSSVLLTAPSPPQVDFILATNIDR